ncbi:MAG TPA: DUF4383 domain-containing protein [Cyanobacteria bacterium UBA8803]|nr:DUF4383 domain-containing protein [Cyanobacteria bacterium UBA9273]HBL62498.1 DUF4383 domain-containing protein [Cyanobacteria bacterium UBA8803]
MKERNIALTIGIIFLVLGIAGFIPALVSLPPAGASPNVPLDAPSVTYDTTYGYLFGMFPTNLLHNIVHAAVGLLGIAAYTTQNSSRLYLRVFAIAYVLIAIMGLLPFTNTTFGLMPIFGNNVWFNALTAAIAGYYGFFGSTPATDMQAPRGI